MIEILLVKLKPFLPGLAGAMLAALTGPERRKMQRAVEFCAGCVIAYTFTDSALEFFRLSTSYLAPVAFALGYFGMTIANALMSALRDTNWVEIIKNRIGGGR